jgi:hypothetical protein
MTPREVDAMRLDELHAFEAFMRRELEAIATAQRRARSRRR